MSEHMHTFPNSTPFMAGVIRDRDAKTQALIRQVESWSMTRVVKRYAADNGVPDEVAAIHERELKRYLVLCALFPREILGMNGPVDELWHTFIIFTKDYQDFCKTIAGRYIHHEPNSTDDPKSVEENSYALMLKRYTEVFQEIPPHEVWPSPFYIEITDDDEKPMMRMWICRAQCGPTGECGCGTDSGECETPPCSDSGGCDTIPD